MPDPLALEAMTLWRLQSYGAERYAAGSAYWWDNRVRPGEAMVFQVTIAGTMVLRTGDHDLPVPVGHAALFRYGEGTAYGLPPGATEGYACRWVDLGGAGLAAHWEALQARFGRVVPCDAETLAALDRLIERAHPRRASDPVAASAAVHEFVLGLFARLRRQRLAAQSAVERAVEAMLANPTAAPPLKKLAEQCGCSREHLTRVFAARTGLPPATWLARARLERALALLRDTELPVAAVAAQCGYGSAHTLARQVRAATGKSPKALRRRR